MEMAWLQEIERRRREAGGRSLAEAERGGGGGAREREQERMVVAQQSERPRSMHHLDRRQLLNEQVRTAGVCPMDCVYVVAQSCCAVLCVETGR